MPIVYALPPSRVYLTFAKSHFLRVRRFMFLVLCLFWSGLSCKGSHSKSDSDDTRIIFPGKSRFMWIGICTEWGLGLNHRRCLRAEQTDWGISWSTMERTISIVLLDLFLPPYANVTAATFILAVDDYHVGSPAHRRNDWKDLQEK
jgi:hypothetical protein